MSANDRNAMNLRQEEMLKRIMGWFEYTIPSSEVPADDPFIEDSPAFLHMYYEDEDIGLPSTHFDTWFEYGDAAQSGTDGVCVWEKDTPRRFTSASLDVPAEVLESVVRVELTITGSSRGNDGTYNISLLGVIDSHTLDVEMEDTPEGEPGRFRAESGVSWSIKVFVGWGFKPAFLASLNFLPEEERKRITTLMNGPGWDDTTMEMIFLTIQGMMLASFAMFKQSFRLKYTSRIANLTSEMMLRQTDPKSAPPWIP